MELGGGLGRGRIYGTRIPGAGQRRADWRVADGRSRRAGTGGGVATNQAETSVGIGGNPAIGCTGGRPDQWIRIGRSSSGRGTLPHVLSSGRNRCCVPILVGCLFAFGLGGGGAGAIVGAGWGTRLRLLPIVQLASSCRYRRIVRTVRSTSALMQRVVVVLAGGVRRHAQPQWEAISSCHAALVVVVMRGRSGRLMVVVASIEAALLKIRIHGWSRRSTIRNAEKNLYPRGVLRKISKTAKNARKIGEKILFFKNWKNVIHETRTYVNKTIGNQLLKFLRYKFRLKTYVRHGRKNFLLSSILNDSKIFTLLLRRMVESGTWLVGSFSIFYNTLRFVSPRLWN